MATLKHDVQTFDSAPALRDDAERDTKGGVRDYPLITVDSTTWKHLFDELWEWYASAPVEVWNSATLPIEDRERLQAWKWEPAEHMSETTIRLTNTPTNDWPEQYREAVSKVRDALLSDTGKPEGAPTYNVDKKPFRDAATKDVYDALIRYGWIQETEHVTDERSHSRGVHIGLKRDAHLTIPRRLRDWSSPVTPKTRALLDKVTEQQANRLRLPADLGLPNRDNMLPPVARLIQVYETMPEHLQVEALQRGTWLNDIFTGIIPHHLTTDQPNNGKICGKVTGPVRGIPKDEREQLRQFLKQSGKRAATKPS